MLELDPSKRVRSKKLYDILAPFESKILDLQPFEVNPPTQIQYGYPVGFNPNNNYIPQQQAQQFRPVNQYQPYYTPNNPDSFHHGQHQVIIN